jgi:hypothetical protein
MRGLRRTAALFGKCRHNVLLVAVNNMRPIYDLSIKNNAFF